MSVNDTDGFVQDRRPTPTATRSSACTWSATARSDLISEGALAIEMGAVLQDVQLTIHPHPTLREAVMEAAAAARERGDPHHQPLKRRPSGCVRRIGSISAG